MSMVKSKGSPSFWMRNEETGLPFNMVFCVIQIPYSKAVLFPTRQLYDNLDNFPWAGGAGMLLPDQISFWRQRFVVKDVTTGSAIFRLEGTLEDRSALANRCGPGGTG